MATTPQFVTLSNGQKLAVGVYNAFLKLQAAAKAATGDILWVASGYRTHAEQVRIFTQRYRQVSSNAIRGPFNDVRFWNGSKYGYPGTTRWVRYSPEGTVAVPGTSLHEKASAVDWGGNGGKANTRLGIWLKSNAARFGFTPSGYGFGESWHYDFTGNPWAGSGSTPIPTPTPPKPNPAPKPIPDEEEDDMPKNSGFYYDNIAAGPNTVTYLILNTGSGFFSEFSNGVGKGPAAATYINQVAVAFDTGNWAKITQSHADAIKRALKVVDDLGPVTILDGDAPGSA